MRDLLEAARIYYDETKGAMAELEEILALDEEEVRSIGTDGVDGIGDEDANSSPQG
jgi:phosphate:Na+ symporter